MNDYQSVLQMIRDGAEPAEVEAILSADETPLTDDQIASLRTELSTQSPAEAVTQYVVIAEQSYPIDSAAECEAADQALLDAGLSETPVYAGDPECPDSYRNGRVYRLSTPAVEVAYAADRAYDQARDDALTGDR